MVKPEPMKRIQDHQEGKQEIVSALNGRVRVIVQLIVVRNHNSIREIVESQVNPVSDHQDPRSFEIIIITNTVFTDLRLTNQDISEIVEQHYY